MHKQIIRQWAHKQETKKLRNTTATTSQHWMNISIQVLCIHLRVWPYLFHLHLAYFQGMLPAAIGLTLLLALLVLYFLLRLLRHLKSP